MSTKTIKQRIALVAVSALTAGLFTVVSAPVANAVLMNTNSTMQESSLVIWHTADTDGTPDVTSAVYATATTTNQGTSLGWVSDTTVSGTTNTANVFQRIKGTPVVATSIAGGTAGAIRTAAVLPGAKISFILAGSITTTGITAVVTGGTLGSLTSTSGSVSLNGSQTSASVYSPITGTETLASSTNTPIMSGVFNISGAAGSTATLSAYSGALIVDGDTRTSGALVGVWTFTVVAASASGTFSAGDSTVTQQACVAKSSAAAGTNSFDTTSRCADGRMGVVYVSLKDAYTSSITGGSLTATATGGSLVNVINTTPTSGANYAASAAFASATLAATNYVVVTQPVAGVGGSTTVTITHQGNVVGTKTINWGGDVASITVDPTRSAKVIGNGQTAVNVGNGTVTSYLTGVVYVYKDAAGNVLSGLTPTMTGQTGAMLGASLATTTGPTMTSAVHYATFVTVAQTSSLGYGASTIEHPGGTASANYGAGSYQIQVLNSAGTAVKSNVITVTVSKLSAQTFEASFDKASYSPGDIATLTITAKDDGGRLMASGFPLTGLSIVTGTGLTVAGDACAATSTFTNGVKTCTFGVGNTGGAYAWSVALTTGSFQTPALGSVKVVDGAVSNAEVLKSIVALIASINKQIAALQKLILKR